jgi:DNA-binding NarL/FixJ family response regulator
MRVLVADDCEAVVDRVYELLREIEGIELAGRAAAVCDTSRLIDELHPDILILDLQLLDGSGLPVLMAIKRSHPASAVIVLTNSVARPVRERCFQAGADFFLDKSNDFECLPQIVRGLVHTARTTHQPPMNSRQLPRACSADQSHKGDDNLRRLG